MAGQVKQVTANERHLHDLSSPAESSSDGGNLSHVMRTTPTQRINVKLIPSPVASGHNGRGSQNLENMLQSILSMPDDESARHSKNVLSLRQQPAARACRFDTFVWIPDDPNPDVYVAAQAAPNSNAATRLQQLGAADGCGEVFGVLAGSSAMDGQRGLVQREAACLQQCAIDEVLGSASPPPAPPPRSPASPEPSPPPPPSPWSPDPPSLPEPSPPPPPSPEPPEPSPPSRSPPASSSDASPPSLPPPREPAHQVTGISSSQTAFPSQQTRTAMIAVGAVLGLVALLLIAWRVCSLAVARSKRGRAQLAPGPGLRRAPDQTVAGPTTPSAPL